MKKLTLSILFMGAAGYVAVFPMTYGHYIADALGWGQALPFIHEDLLPELLGKLLIFRIAPTVVIAAILASLLRHEGMDPLFLGSLGALIPAGCLLALSLLPATATPAPNRAAAFLVFLASLSGLILAFRRASRRAQAK